MSEAGSTSRMDAKESEKSNKPCSDLLVVYNTLGFVAL